MSLDKVKKICRDIDAKKIAPIYLLMGEEPFYIDVVSKYIEDHVLTDAEKGFNQMILYGRDVTVEDIISNCKTYPLGPKKQVIIVKEAQDLSRMLDDLVEYAEKPQPSTVLVLCHKHKSYDKRKKLPKVIEKTGVVMDTKKLAETQVAEWIRSVLASRGFTITPKASQMLVEFLGNDLGKVNNELEKLQLILKPGEQITDKIVEDNIGISKDFNNFELQKALGNRDVKKAFAIVQYFSQNPKNNPVVMTLGILYSYFSKILLYHASPNKAEAAKAMGVPHFYMKEYDIAAGN